MSQQWAPRIVLQKRQQQRSPKNVRLDLAINRPVAAIGAGLDDNGLMTTPGFKAAIPALKRLHGMGES